MIPSCCLCQRGTVLLAPTSFKYKRWQQQDKARTTTRLIVFLRCLGSLHHTVPDSYQLPAVVLEVFQDQCDPANTLGKLSLYSQLQAFASNSFLFSYPSELSWTAKKPQSPLTLFYSFKLEPDQELGNQSSVPFPCSSPCFAQLSCTEFPTNVGDGGQENLPGRKHGALLSCPSKALLHWQPFLPYILILMYIREPTPEITVRGNQIMWPLVQHTYTQSLFWLRSWVLLQGT